MSLLFNVLSRFVIAFLPRNKCLLISWLQSRSAEVLEPEKIKFLSVSVFFSIYLPWSDRTRYHDLMFWMLSSKTAFLLSSFTSIGKLFRSSSISVIKVVSSVYLRLLIFLKAILIPDWVSSSPAFHMMYSACKLNKQGHNIEWWSALFWSLNQPVVPCPVLADASWPAYSFLRKQVRWSATPISWRIFHSFLWSTQWKAFSSVQSLSCVRLFVTQ